MFCGKLIIRRFSSYYHVSVENFEKYLDVVTKCGGKEAKIAEFGALLDRDWVLMRDIKADFSVSFINLNTIKQMSKKLNELKE